MERVSEEESAAYFESRPRSSRIGAWVSLQSAVVAGGRAEIEARCVHSDGGGGSPSCLSAPACFACACQRPQAEQSSSCTPCNDLQHSMHNARALHATPATGACRQAQLEEQYADATVPVPKPPHWGGFLVRPLAVEFWQGRPSRLHDRLRYVRDTTDSSEWRLQRLYP